MPRLPTEHERHLYRQSIAKIANGYLFPNDVTDKQAVKINLVARSVERDESAKIRSLINAGRVRDARRMQRKYIAKFACKLVAAQKNTKPAKNGNPSRFVTAHSHATLIGFQASPGELRLMKKEKAGGGTRIIGNFNQTDKAQQKLLANAIKPFFGDHPGQYGTRGRDFAVETLRQHVEMMGPETVFLHADITQFYDQVSHEWLRKNTPLPSSMIDWVLPSGYTITPMATRRQALRITEEEIESMAQRGLPQGSALSPCVAEIVIADIISDLGDSLRYPLVNYSDNFGLVVPAETALRLGQSLRERLRSHPAGPFELRVTITPVTEECRFMGYSFCLKPDGNCDFWVRETDWRDRFGFHSDRLQNCTPERVDHELKRMQSYINAWPAWSGRTGLQAMWRDHAKSICEDRGFTNLAEQLSEGDSEPLISTLTCEHDLIEQYHATQAEQSFVIVAGSRVRIRRRSSQSGNVCPAPWV